VKGDAESPPQGSVGGGVGGGGVGGSGVGRVTMDMTMVDITDIPDAAVGDEVVLIGKQGDETITAEELAAWADTINYEIFCGISHRVPRYYSDIPEN
jgi:alanine racemase